MAYANTRVGPTVNNLRYLVPGKASSLVAHSKGPTEGGSGGKRGHSAMEHWERTEEIKRSTKTTRRRNDKSESSQGISDHEKGKSSGE